MIAAVLTGGLAWIGLCVLVGVLAASFNRNGAVFFLLAFVISPLLAVILLLVMGKKTSSTKSGPPQLQCPKCNTVNDPQARHCQGCGVQILGPKST